MLQSQVWLGWNKVLENGSFCLVIPLGDGNRLHISPYGDEQLHFKIVDGDGDIRHDTFPRVEDLVALTKRGFPVADQSGNAYRIDDDGHAYGIDD